jgi:hypothetical protein
MRLNHHDLSLPLRMLAQSRHDSHGRISRAVWDPSRPGAEPAELSRHYGPVAAAAVLADGHVVTGGTDQRVLVWDPARSHNTPDDVHHARPSASENCAVSNHWLFGAVGPHS